MISLRKASFFERYQICRTENKYYSNFNVTVEYPFPISKAKLSHAISSLIRDNPILGCNFFGSTDNDYKDYVLKSIPITFDSVVEYTEFDVSSEFFEFLNTIYFEMNCTKPLWKLFIKDNRITICCNHGFFDGNGGAFFHKELFRLLENTTDDVEFKDILSKEVDLLPKSVMETCPLYKTPIWFLIRGVLQSWIPNWVKKLMSYCTYPNINKYPMFKNKPISLNQRTKYSVINLNNDTVSKMLAITRSTSTKLTPWLITIALQTFQEFHPNRSMSIAIPLNGRRYFDLDMFQVAVAQSSIDIEPITNPIATTNYITKHLQRDLDSRHPFYLVGFLKYINIGSFLKSKIGTHSRSTMEISNVGKMPLPCWFSQDNGFSSHLQFNVVSSPQGMNIVIGLLDLDVDSYTKAFLKRIMAVLDAHVD
ncbi:N-acetyltransferase, putative [Candida dubliniensis CD36]|uniref:N-acetyltransferase, putative n=1 Tax=Candida dubliniensis (strain CD36 / ATCC MYA-646 / CBS 7987 / NCPF 3949 / NRRL Y-17841) TaxID=573826 RepID=B9WBQ5_CANDC|nr:N-acetyltransferase, putative [Candida dubliniensis CD36]CAX43826.1 N-acetyltransferase, putative [Candida dubliniensis CD36]